MLLSPSRDVPGTVRNLRAPAFWLLLTTLLQPGPAQPIAIGLTVEPVVGETPAREWAFEVARPVGDLEKAFRAGAASSGAAVVADPEGLLFTSSRYFAPGLDNYCIYPIVNAKTGGRTHTFASFNLSIAKKSERRRVAGSVLGRLVLTPKGDSSRLHFTSQCRTDSELGDSWATSRGLFEKELIESSLRRLGLNLEVPLPAEHETYTTFVEYRPETERPLGSQVHPTRSRIPGQRADWTLVRVPLSTSAPTPWSKMLKIAGALAAARGEALQVDEAQRKASFGFDEFPSAPPETAEAWADSIQLQIRTLPEGKEEIVARRRLVLSDPDAPGRWKSAPGTGAVERWILTSVLSAEETLIPQNAADTPSIVEPVTRSAPAESSPATPVSQSPQGHGATEEKKAETSDSSTCTLDQILAMKNAGLTDQQVRAACREPGQPAPE